MMERPCLQRTAPQYDAESPHVRFSEDQFELQKPMTEGVRVIQVCVPCKQTGYGMD